MTETCKIWLNLITSCIGIVLGVSAFIVFTFFYNNVAAGIWALASALFAGVTFHLHHLYYRRKLSTWHSAETLQGIKFLGLATLLTGLAGMSWFIFITIYNHIPVLPVSESTVIRSVWAFMTAKWGFLLLLSARHYCNYVIYDNVPQR